MHIIQSKNLFILQKVLIPGLYNMSSYHLITVQCKDFTYGHFNNHSIDLWPHIFTKLTKKEIETLNAKCSTSINMERWEFHSTELNECVNCANYPNEKNSNSSCAFVPYIITKGLNYFVN